MFNTSFLVILALAAVATAEYNVPKPTTKYDEPSIQKTPHLPNPKVNIAIDGFVLCNTGNLSYPIQGAKVKLVCPLSNSKGETEALVVVSSNPTDVKGYFIITPYGLTERVKNVKACKVKLESSPLSACKIPTNLNRGLAGAPLWSYNQTLLHGNNFHLYTIGPFFFYGPEPPKPRY